MAVVEMKHLHNQIFFNKTKLENRVVQAQQLFSEDIIGRINHHSNVWICILSLT